ncbi:MAG: hypothetical protein JRJ59_00720 [Deltaproteobacteria bacterium]|nr:hypothetical protein [Deltaproteobacteria bacterium]
MSSLKKLSVILLAAGFCLAAGCKAPQPKTSIEPIIAPYKANISAARLGIFCFRTPFQDPVLESHLAHQLHQDLLARRIARVVEVIPETFRDLSEAIDRARILGYDVVILGQIQEAFWGGDIEPSKATVELRAVDAVRKLTIWYLKGTARAKPRPGRDLILCQTDGTPARMPQELVRRLLMELSDELALQIARQSQTAGALPGKTHPQPESP